MSKPNNGEVKNNVETENGGLNEGASAQNPVPAREDTPGRIPNSDEVATDSSLELERRYGKQPPQRNKGLTE